MLSSIRESRRILCFVTDALGVLLLAGTLAAQSGTLTDDAFLSSNPPTQLLNLNGQGIALFVAGSSCALHSGTATAYVKFQLQSSLPSPVSAASVVKATLKLFVSPASNPSGAIDIYPITNGWTESTLIPSSPPVLTVTPFALGVPLTRDGSFLIVDVTQLVRSWLNGPVNGGTDNNGIALSPHTATTCAVFDSKEGIVTSHEPRLEIVLANAGPQGPAGPSGTSGFANFSCPAGQSITDFDSAAHPVCGSTTSGGGGSQLDSDGDGIPDALDPCPLSPNLNFNGGSYCPATVYDVNTVSVAPGAMVFRGMYRSRISPGPR